MGQFHLSDRGKARVSVGGIGKEVSARTSRNNRTWSEVVVRGIGSNYLSLRIEDVDPSDPVEDVRLIAPGLPERDQIQVYTNEYLRRIAFFAVLRFMDPMMTNVRAQSPNGRTAALARRLFADWCGGDRLRRHRRAWRTPYKRRSGSTYQTGRVTITSGGSRA